MRRAALLGCAVLGALLAPSVVAAPRAGAEARLGLSSGAPAASAAGAGTVTVDVAADRPTGRINEDLLGTNQSYAPAGPLVSKLAPHWARTDASLDGSIDGHPVYDCTTGAFDPSLLDARIGADEAEGAIPEIIVDYSPACLTTFVPPGTSAQNAPPDAEGYQRWDALVEQMARHEIEDEGVRVFEVWNEPDWTFFTGGLDAYLALYTHTAGALEAAAAEAGAGIEVGGPATVTADPLWISALAQLASTEHLPLDFVSWHDYANDPLVGPLEKTPIGEMPPPSPHGVPTYWENPAVRPSQYAQETQLVRSVLSPYRALHPALVVDEWNLDAGYDPRHDGPYDAAFAAGVLGAAQAVGLDDMAFFRVVDDTTGDPFGNWGMLSVGPGGVLVPKPVYVTFLFWHELAGAKLRATVAAPLQGPGGEVGAVASRPVASGASSPAAAGGGAVLRVMIWNFVPYDPTGADGTTDPTAYDHAVDLAVRGLGPGRFEITRLVVDGASRGAPAGSPASETLGPGGTLRDRFTAFGDSVSLLEVTRSGG